LLKYLLNFKSDLSPGNKQRLLRKGVEFYYNASIKGIFQKMDRYDSGKGERK